MPEGMEIDDSDRVGRRIREKSTGAPAASIARAIVTAPRPPDAPTVIRAASPATPMVSATRIGGAAATVATGTAAASIGCDVR